MPQFCSIPLLAPDKRSGMRPMLGHRLPQNVNNPVSCGLKGSNRHAMARLKRSPAQDTLRALANVPVTVIDSGRQLSPGLTNLPSNNPFRNRAVSPANSLPSPVTTSFGNISNTAPDRPTSRNPFLDQSEKKIAATEQVRSISSEQGASGMAGRTSPSKPAVTGHAVELFVGLTLTLACNTFYPSIDSSKPGQSHDQRRSLDERCTTSRYTSTLQ